MKIALHYHNFYLPIKLFIVVFFKKYKVLDLLTWAYDQVIRVQVSQAGSDLTNWKIIKHFYYHKLIRILLICFLFSFCRIVEAHHTVAWIAVHLWQAMLEVSVICGFELILKSYHVVTCNFWPFITLENEVHISFIGIKDQHYLSEAPIQNQAFL